MNKIIREKPGQKCLGDEQIYSALESLLKDKNPKKLLILPPDYTRLYSGAGKITAFICDILQGSGCAVDIMPALGTHVPMTEAECNDFFMGRVKHESLIVHRWRDDVVKIGEVPAYYVDEVSDGILNESIDVEINRRIAEGGYDLILSIGQVVPHEVVGMANYSKNIFVGCGGASMINASHKLGAFYGMERIMGKDFSPVRRVFDYAQEKYLSQLPITYILTVATSENDATFIHGIYIGDNRDGFTEAVKDSQRLNLIHLKEPLRRVVVYLDPREFKSTWLGNKAVYRTRMAIADGGSLIVLAPGVDKFGEDPENDRLIRKYGYCGRENVLRLCRENKDLEENMSVAAHLIHGSSDGRFSVTYCTEKLTQSEIESVCFEYIPYTEAALKYDPDKLKDGFNDVDGEKIFYISNPALGLWTIN